MVVVELIRGRDGKRYPVERRYPADRRRFATLTHHLRHGRRLSILAVQETLASEFGVRRSRGAICKDIRDFTCPLCAAGAAPTVPGIRGPAVPAETWEAPAPPAPPVKPAAFDWR